MKMIMAAAILGIGAAMSATSASAAPVGKMIGGKPSAATAKLIKVHGVHKGCQLTHRGWHRSPRKGVYIACRPARPKGHFWSWRKKGSNWGWYNIQTKRWR